MEMNDGYEFLAAAIVERALLDYRTALTEKDESMVCECERFLRSQWFSLLSDSDGEILIAMIRRSVA